MKDLASYVLYQLALYLSNTQLWYKQETRNDIRELIEVLLPLYKL